MARVSVVMPMLNAERYVRQALESILGQTYDDFEFVIIDDGSSDGSRDIVQSYHDRRLRVLENGKTLGLARSLNRGLEIASGDLIARQDADDVSHPRRLERQVHAMLNDPRLALLGTQGRVIDVEGAGLGVVNRPLEDASIHWYGVLDNPFIHTSVMFRRKIAWEEFGGFEARFDPYSQDYALWSAILQKHQAANLPEPLVDYRVHTTSITGIVEGGVGAHHRRSEYRTMLAELLGRNVHRLGLDLSLIEVDLLCGYVLGVPEAQISTFLSQYRRVLRRYLERNPSAEKSSDFRRTIGRQYDAIAHRTAPSRRRGALKVYWQAVQDDPGLVRWLPWSRALARVVLGEAGLTRLKRLRRQWAVLPV